MYNDRNSQAVTIQVSAIDGIQMPQSPMPAQPMAQASAVAQGSPVPPETPPGAQELSQRGKTAFVAALEAVRQYHMAKDPAEKEKWKAAAENLHQIVLSDGPQFMSSKVEYTALMANEPSSGMGGKTPGPKGNGPKVSVPPVKPVVYPSRKNEPAIPGKPVPSRKNQPPMEGKLVRAFDRNAPKQPKPTAPPQAQGTPNPQAPVVAAPLAGQAPKAPAPNAGKQNENKGADQPIAKNNPDVIPTTPLPNQQGNQSGSPEVPASPAGDALTTPASEGVMAKGGLPFGEKPDANVDQDSVDTSSVIRVNEAMNNGAFDGPAASQTIAAASKQPIGERGIKKMADLLKTDKVQVDSFLKGALNSARPAPQPPENKSPAVTQQVPDAEKPVQEAPDANAQQSESAKTKETREEVIARFDAKIREMEDKIKNNESSGNPTFSHEDHLRVLKKKRAKIIGSQPEGTNTQQPESAKPAMTDDQLDAETERLKAESAKARADLGAEKNKGVPVSETPQGEKPIAGETGSPDDIKKASDDFNDEINKTTKANSTAEVDQAKGASKPIVPKSASDEALGPVNKAFEEGTKAKGIDTAQTALNVLHHLIGSARSFVGGRYAEGVGGLANAAATREGFRSDQKVLQARQDEAKGETDRWGRIVKKMNGEMVGPDGKSEGLTTTEAVAARRAFKRYDLKVKKAIAAALNIPNAKNLTSDELNVEVDNFFNKNSPDSQDAAERHDQMLQQNQKFVDTMDAGGTLTPAQVRGFKNDLHALTHDELKSLAESQGFSPYGSRKLLINQLKSKIDSHEEGRVAREKAKAGSKELLDEQVDRLKLSLNKNGELEPEEPITKKAQVKSMTGTFSKLSDDDKVATLKRMVEDPDEIDQLKGTGLNARFREEIMKHVTDDKTRGEMIQEGENDAVAAKIKGGEAITADQVKSTLRSLKGISEDDLRDFADKLGVPGFGTKGIDTLKVDVENAIKAGVPEEQKGPTDKQKQAEEENNRIRNEAAGFADKIGKDLSGTLEKGEAKTFKGHLSKLPRPDLEKLAESYGLDMTASTPFLKEQLSNIIDSREASKVARDKKNEGTALGLGEDVGKLNLNMDDMSGVARPTSPITAAKIAQMKEGFAKQTEDVQKSLLGSLGVDQGEIDALGNSPAGLKKRFAEELAKHELKLPKEGDSQQMGENFNVADKVAKGEAITEDEFNALKGSFPKDRQDLTAMANAMGIETPKGMGNETIKVKMTRMARKLVQKEEEINKLANKSSRIANDISGWADHLSEDSSRTLDPEFASAFVGKVKDLTTDELEETAEKLGLDPDNPSTGELYDDSVLVEMIKAAVKKRITPKSELNPTRSVDPGEDSQGGGEEGQGGGGTPKGTPPKTPAGPATPATPENELPFGEVGKQGTEIPKPASGPSAKPLENTGEPIAKPAAEKPATSTTSLRAVADSLGFRGDKKRFVAANKIEKILSTYFGMDMPEGSDDKKLQQDRYKAWSMVYSQMGIIDRVFTEGAQPEDVEKFLDTIAGNMAEGKENVLEGTKAEGDYASQSAAKTAGANAKPIDFKSPVREKLASAGIKVDPKDEDALDTLETINNRIAELSTEADYAAKSAKSGRFPNDIKEYNELSRRGMLLWDAARALRKMQSGEKPAPPKGPEGGDPDDKGPGDGGGGQGGGNTPNAPSTPPSTPPTSAPAETPTPPVTPAGPTEVNPEPVKPAGKGKGNGNGKTRRNRPSREKPAPNAPPKNFDFEKMIGEVTEDDSAGELTEEEANAAAAELDKLADDEDGKRLKPEQKKAWDFVKNATPEQLRAKLNEAGLGDDKDKGKDSIEAIAKQLAGVLKKKDGKEPEKAKAPPEPDEDWASRFAAGGDLVRQPGESEAAHEARVRAAGEKKTAADDKRKKALAAAKKKVAEAEAAKAAPATAKTESEIVSQKFKDNNAATPAPKPKVTPQVSWDDAKPGSELSEAEVKEKMDGMRSNPDVVHSYEDEENGTEAFVTKGKGKLAGQYGVNLVDAGTGESVGPITFHPTLKRANAAAMKATNQTSNRALLAQEKQKEIEEIRELARSEGHDPKHLDKFLPEIKKEHNARVEAYNTMLKEARESLQSMANDGQKFSGAKTKGVPNAKKIADNGGDWVGIKGIDRVAEELAGVYDGNGPYAEFFKKPTGETGSYEDQLFEMLAGGNMKPMSDVEAYKAALNRMMSFGPPSGDVSGEDVAASLSRDDDEAWKDVPSEGGDLSFDVGEFEGGEEEKPFDPDAVANKLKTGGTVTPEEAKSARDAYAKMSGADKVAFAKALGLSKAGGALDSTRDDLVEREIINGEFRHSRSEKGIEPELQEGGTLFNEPGIGESAGLFDEVGEESSKPVEVKKPTETDESKKVSEGLKARAARRNIEDAPKPQAAPEPETKPTPVVKKKEPEVASKPEGGVPDGLIAELQAVRANNRKSQNLGKKEATALAAKLEKFTEEQLKESLGYYQMAPVNSHKLTKAQIIAALVKSWRGGEDD